MNYKEAKRYYKLTDDDIGKAFGYKNGMSYCNSNHYNKHAETFTKLTDILKEGEDERMHERLGEMLKIYQKACKALKVLSIDTADFIKYLKRLE